MADNFTPTQAQKMKLAGSGCTASATSIILQSLTLPDGTTAIAMSDFGDIGYATIEPGGSREEQISFTGITSNTLTGVTRGLRFVAPYDEVTANKFAHAGGSILVFSNTAAFYSELSSRDNDETISGLYTFTQFPQKSGSTTPSATADFATKGYVDSVVAGTSVYDQNIISDTAGEDLVAGNLIYLKASDGKWWKTDADTAATVDGVILGFAQETISADAEGNILIGGIDKNQTGLTAGTTYYAGNTAGAIVSSAGTTERAIGKAISTTEIILDADFNVRPTAKQKEALAGSGTPSSSNKYVTEDTVNARLPVGTVAMHIAAAAPTGWLLCDGTSYLQADYAALFAIIGTTYGSADGTHFNVPDFRGRTPIGVGTGAGGGASGTGAPTGGTALTAVARAGWKGEETHVITAAEMAAHTHDTLINIGGGTSGANSVINNQTTTNATFTSSSVGSNTAHNNIQPVMGINFIIKT